MRTVGPILVSSSRPDELTRLLAARYHAHASSSALQETDLSVPPLGLDIQDNEPPDSFRRQTLLSLDILRGLLLALLAGESIQMFLRSEEESDENWYSKQDRWTESPLYALRLAAVSLRINTLLKIVPDVLRGSCRIQQRQVSASDVNETSWRSMLIMLIVERLDDTRRYRCCFVSAESAAAGLESSRFAEAFSIARGSSHGKYSSLGHRELRNEANDAA